MKKAHLLLNWNNRMKICYIDAFSGLAGDMLVAALADAGADRETISRALESFAIGATIQWDRVQRRGISALKFRVGVTEPPKHRHLSGILKMIHAADLPASAKSKSERVFRVLGEAEAGVHGVDIEKVHFHEVGAVDSICDIVGICLALDLLGVETIYCSPINTGSGTVNTEHGVLPVPAPATATLLQNKPIYARGPAIELTTPTGAAVVAALANDFGAMPPMRVHTIGYGAGDKDFKEHANVVRVMIGEASGTISGEMPATTVTVIEANIDDASPQLIGYAVERMLEAGALDTLVIPAQMKKGRPGVVIQVITEHEKREELIAILLRETTTLGVRFHSAERRVDSRRLVEVSTSHGIVRIKESDHGFAPEYEDARKIAYASGVPLKQVLAEAAHAYLKQK
jgi:pyridinium-3,5-bisthiocarboxylic acid mononucleotide nickel chelatase